MSYDKHIAIVQAIRRAVPQFSHYQEVSKRIVPFLMRELGGIADTSIPTEYQVSVDAKKQSYGNSYTIHIWGNGLLYNEGVHLFWTETEFPVWQDGIQHALNVNDMSDYQEREREEEKILPSLQVLELMITDCRKKAKELVGALPTPASATIRKIWDNPSAKLSDQFPQLFKSR